MLEFELAGVSLVHEGDLPKVRTRPRSSAILETDLIVMVELMLCFWTRVWSVDVGK